MWTNAAVAADANADGAGDGRSVADDTTHAADDTTVPVEFHSIHRKHRTRVAYAPYPDGNSLSHRNNSPDTPSVFHPDPANRKNRNRAVAVHRMAFHCHPADHPFRQSCPTSWARWNDGDRGDGVQTKTVHPFHRCTVVALIYGRVLSYPHPCSTGCDRRLIARTIDSYRPLVRTRWKCSSPDIIEAGCGGMSFALTPVDD